jgi:gentisate 1,2-dioxygenase
MAIEQIGSDEMEAFYEELHGKRLDALWRGRPPVPSGAPKAPYPPCRWQWSEIRPALDRAARLVRPGPEAERRVIQLINPALGATRAATHTLSANVQMVLPGEIAPSHRHTNAAIRFIIEGEAAMTIVDGEPVSMSPGDLVLTAGWCWHGHVNQSDGPMLWMDSLDRPLSVSLKQGLFEQYPDELQPATKPMGDSSWRYGNGHFRPVGVRATSPVSPLFSYPWAETERALHNLAKTTPNPFDDVAFDYTHPLTGGHVLPTIGCRIQMLRGESHTRAHRHSYTSCFYVFRGRGATIVDGVQMDWQAGDFFALPPFCWHEHLNATQDEAVLFSTTDEPVMEALDMLREEAYPEGGGYQAVTGTYSD